MSKKTSNAEFQPLDSGLVPRFAGFPTFMRLPIAEPDQVDVALVGVPFDSGTTNRTGARHGPREIRNQSSLVRRVHHVTGLSPLDRVKCGDCGDAAMNPLDVMARLERIEESFHVINMCRARSRTPGADLLVSLPILRAVTAKGPVVLIHFDAHSDTYDSFSGSRYNHGTPFRRAIEEGLLDPKRVIQIGIRGALYGNDDMKWAYDQGIRVVTIEEFFALGVDKVVEEARRVVGDQPTYVSFDVDGLDPVFAPGTGTPEVGGYSTHEAQRMIRGLRGLDLVGADVVEVSPPFDPSGGTALVGVTMMWELMCLLAESVA